MEYCFGCGADNPQGLHLQFEEVADGAVTATATLDEHHSGEPGIVHGGIQATLLDEVMGRAVQRRLRELTGMTGTSVTATFELRYRRPCATGTPVTARGWVTATEWPSVLVQGCIEDADGSPVTEATARWRVLEPELAPEDR